MNGKSMPAAFAGRGITHLYGSFSAGIQNINQETVPKRKHSSLLLRKKALKCGNGTGIGG